MQQALLVHFGYLEPAADAQAQNEYESYLGVISELTVEEAHQICAEEEIVVRPSTLCRSIHVRLCEGNKQWSGLTCALHVTCSRATILYYLHGQPCWPTLSLLRPQPRRPITVGAVTLHWPPKTSGRLLKR
jgi:hypothetical protein